MLYLALERVLPAVARPDLPELLRLEAAAVWQLQKAGTLRAIWFTAPERDAVLLLECTSLGSARTELARLPLTRAGVTEFTVHELQAYDGYERLFAVDALHQHRPPSEPPEY